jgi:hypothetical protein
MLRQIVSLSLAMTACVTFVSTKANAATLTVATADSLEKKPGQSITFTISFLYTGQEPEPLYFKSLFYTSDDNELAFFPNSYVATPGTLIDGSTVLAQLMFSVLPPNPVKDGQSDISNVGAVYYTKFLDKEIPGVIFALPPSFDVVPVPEPLTIFGTFMALGGGVLFKRKFFKMKKS